MAGPSSFNNRLLFAMGKAPLINLRDRVPSALDMMGGEDVQDVGTVGLAPETVANQVEQSSAAVPDSTAPEEYGSMWDSANRGFASLQPTPEELELRKRSEELFRQKQTEQQGSVRDLESTLKNYLAGSGQTNLKPLLGLVDSWTGSKTAQNYAEPESEDKKQEKALHIQDLIAKRKGDITQSELDFIKSRLHDTTNARLVEAMNRQAGREAGMARKADQDVNRFLSTVEKDATAQGAQFNQMDEAFASGRYGQIIPLLAIFARSVSGEKGALNEGDIRRVLPRNYQGTLADFESYFSKIPSADIPKEFTTELRALISRAKKEAQQKYERMISSNQQRLSKLPSYREYAGDYKPVFEDTKKNLGQWLGSQGGSQPTSDIDESDPRVKEALANGYSREEIKKFIKK